MPSFKHGSKSARTAPVAIGFLIALLAVLAVRPIAALAAPLEAPVEPGPPQLAIEPGSYDFGLQPLNWGSRETSFQLRNVGTEAFQVGSPEIVGPGHDAFWAGYSPCYGSYLQPGESCAVQVYFGPHDAVEYAAQFRVSVGSFSFAANLAGTGGRATFAPDSNPTDFGVAKVGSAGTTRQIEITNTGNMPGGVFIAVIASGAIGSFQILDENCTGVELVPTATCTLQARFQPVSEGVKKATLGLFGESEGPTPIVLTGVGTAPDPVSILAAGSPMTGATVGAEGPKIREYRPKGDRRHKRHRLAVHDARLVLRAR
jgi:hypothetical protein